jgi:peptide/nickel transport system substrate-binding protein
MQPQNHGEPILGYYAVPLPATGFVAFNASRAPFSDPDVRRAAALALDRDALAVVWGAIPTDQLLPPSMPGFDDRELYSLNEPALDDARSLMGGRRTRVTMAIGEACDVCRREAEVVRANLAQIGITVRVRELPDPAAAASTPGAKIDLLSLTTPLHHGDPASFLAEMLLREVPPPWLPDGVAREVERLLRLEGSDRRTAAAPLADHLATVDVPLAATRTPIEPSLLAPSLGCRVFPAFGYGVDLAALCLNDKSRSAEGVG